MTRIAVVANSTVLGGAELYMSGLYRLLSPGVDASLLGRLPSWQEAGLPAESVAVGPKWSRRNVVRSAVAAPGETRRMIDRTRAMQADWAHLQYKREQILLTRPLSKTMKVLWTEHGMPYAGGGSAVLRQAYRHAAQGVQAIICVSDDVADAVRDIVGPNVAVHTVVNPVDVDRFRPNASGAERDQLRRRILPESWLDRQVAVVACRLHPAKRLDRVISTCRTAGIPLLVVGDGPARANLEKLGSGADVHFLGLREDIPEVLRAADVYMFSATEHGEGLPLSILEAAATGLHVVGFRDDVGNSLIRALGGAVIDPASDLGSRSLREFPDGPASSAREYVARHHAISDWVSRHRHILAGH